MLRICIATLLVGASALASADTLASSVRARATRRTGPIAIDGKLDDSVWSTAQRQSGFVQRFPRDASKPSVETHFSILYDDEAIFVGVWADDPRPELIRALLTRRDVDSPADTITVAFDSYRDRRTAYAFQLNAAGVQRDMLMFDDSNQDDTWDAVWTGDVAVTPQGWTAEYRIPLSQLRFASGASQEWGLQIVRLIGRTGEQDSWSPWPRSAPQVVSKFGVVDGIDNLRSQRRLELLPYASTGMDRLPVEDGDPLNDAYGWRRSIGLDLKYGLGSAFTLSATLNPDFGQVEADPSKVNLSANELFFAEKRPFFLEGVDLFKLPIGNSDNSVEGAFYSRRIGAAPAEPDADHDYIKAPQSTTIYGAAKLTGKAGGWSVGVLNAITGEETAEIVLGGERSEPVVAGLTNYAIARVKRDLRDGGTSIGASATAVNRQIGGTPLEAVIHDQAYTGGLQLQHRWGDNAWTANANLLGSWVHGTAEAIAETQTSSRHYFQRPDAPHIELDATRTSLAGLGAKWMIGRLGDTKHWRYGFGGDLRTPGLELNDAGFQFNSDRVIPFVWGQYRDDTPGDRVLNWQFSSDVFAVHNFEPLLTGWGIESNGSVQFANHWSVSGGWNIDRSRWNVHALRGGRALRWDPGMFAYINANTDTRKPVWFSINGFGSRNGTSRGIDGGIDLGATIQARSNLDIFIGPGIFWRDDPMQYVDEAPDMDGEPHYIFGRIHETDLAMTLRVNWTFSPRFTMQAYAQPFIAAGRYDELKDVNNPGAVKYADRFSLLGDSATLVGDEYQVMRNGQSFNFGQPDFNFRQLRSTVVLRWEYRPGSTVFAIWSHGRTSDAFNSGRFRLGADLGDLGSAASENVVMVKANYWIGL
jgi:Domain of unknown function (DUF5916)/Carbohydrate family 9 binding domain-like